jgi:hypothetical protein
MAIVSDAIDAPQKTVARTRASRCASQQSA